MEPVMRTRARGWWAVGALAAVAVVAFAPGAWRPAVAQTAGEISTPPATPSATASATATGTSTATTTATTTGTVRATATGTAAATGTPAATSTALATPTVTSTVIGTAGGTVTAGRTNVNVPGGVLPPNSRLSVSQDVSLQRPPANTNQQSTNPSTSLNNARNSDAQAVRVLLRLNVQSPDASNTEFRSQFVSDLASALKISVSQIVVNSAQAGFSQAPVPPSAPVGGPRGETRLNGTAVVRFDIPAEGLVLAGGDPRRIIVLRMPDAPTPADRWTEVPCTPEGTVLACTTDRFSIWLMMVIPAPAVVAQAEAQASATPSAPRPSSTGGGIEGEAPAWPRVAALVLFTGAAAGVAGYRASWRRRA